MTKDLRISGSFRFDRAFATAVDLIDRGRVDLQPLLTGVFPVEQAREAFALASDKARATKVQLQFSRVRQDHAAAD